MATTVIVLNGWKEIAAHLHAGVRTLQRYEHFGLPIYRPHGSKRSRVMAFSDELEVWLKSSSGQERVEIETLRGRVAQLEAENMELKRQLDRDALLPRAKSAYA